MVGDDNADLRKVAEQAIEVCWSRQSADVEKMKAKMGDKAPCNIDPFVFSSCSFGYMIHVRIVLFIFSIEMIFSLSRTAQQLDLIQVYI